MLRINMYLLYYLYHLHELPLFSDIPFYRKLHVKVKEGIGDVLCKKGVLTKFRKIHRDSEHFFDKVVGWGMQL